VYTEYRNISVEASCGGHARWLGEMRRKELRAGEKRGKLEDGLCSMTPQS
jgi:hypothetical protein